MMYGFPFFCNLISKTDLLPSHITVSSCYNLTLVWCYKQSQFPKFQILEIKWNIS